MMLFDATISVGNIINIVVFAATGLVAIVTMKSTVGNMKNDLIDVKEEIKKVGQVLVTLAVTTTRLDRLEQDISDVKHGRGFVKNRSEGGINGEWP